MQGNPGRVRQHANPDSRGKLKTTWLDSWSARCMGVAE